ncbi:arylamine N-acetyltransferase, partial [Bacillus thuringiensis]
FDDLDEILLKMGMILPYENLDIMAGTIKNISKDNLIEKLLIQKRGGLCYELNSLLYYFLIDCRFQVYKVAGTVYDLYDNKWKPDDGHVIIILSHEDKDYVVDAGFASHLPLHPVPFNGDVISSQTGEYRIRKRNTRKGTHILEMRKGANGESTSFLQSEPSNEWKIGYAFTVDPIDEKKVNNIQKVIVEHKESPFNKGAITCKLTTYGHISLTNKNYTETFKGTKNKRPIESKDYARILRESFGITQEKYVGKTLERG